MSEWFKKQREKFLSNFQKDVGENANEVENGIKAFFEGLANDSNEQDYQEKVKHLFTEYGHDFIFLCDEKLLSKNNQILDVFFSSLKETYHHNFLEDKLKQYVYLYANHAPTNKRMKEYELDKILHEMKIDDDNFDKDKLLAKLSYQITDYDTKLTIQVENNIPFLNNMLYSLKAEDYQKMLNQFDNETNTDYEKRQKQMFYRFAKLVDDDFAETMNNSELMKFMKSEPFIQFVNDWRPNLDWEEENIKMTRFLMQTQHINQEGKLEILKSEMGNLVSECSNLDMFNYESGCLKIFDTYLQERNKHYQVNYNQEEVEKDLIALSKIVNEMTANTKENNVVLPSNQINKFTQNWMRFLEHHLVYKDYMVNDYLQKEYGYLKKEQFLNCTDLLLRTSGGLKSSRFLFDDKDSSLYYRKFINELDMFNYLNESNKKYPFGLLGFSKRYIDDKILANYLLKLGEKPIINFKSTFNGLMEIHGADVYYREFVVQNREKDIMKNWAMYCKDNESWLPKINQMNKKEDLKVQEFMKIKDNFKDFFEIILENEFSDKQRQFFIERSFNHIVNENSKAIYHLYDNQEMLKLFQNTQREEKDFDNKMPYFISNFLLNKENPKYEQACELVKNEYENNLTFRKDIDKWIGNSQNDDIQKHLKNIINSKNKKTDKNIKDFVLNP